MCLFIYTLPQHCNHLCFQNVSECAVARGIPSSQTTSLTLQAPVFLFDTMRSRSRTPEYYSQHFACKKRKAIRPVPTLCEQCGSSGGAAAAAAAVLPTTAMASSSLRLGSRGVGVGVGADHRAMESALGTEERLLLAEKGSDGSLGRRSDFSGM